LILVLLLLGVAVGAVLFSYYNSNKDNLDYDQRTTEALAQAKAALIGYAVSRGDIAGSARPGDFPCPDTDNDGNAEASCTAGRLGRIPWKTLGIPEPNDASGETLWYASGAFRPDSAQPSTRPINSDTRGDITVYARDGTTQLATQAVAVIFAPGSTLGSQIRDAASAACATTGTSIPRNQCAANYLESSAGRNNAATNGPYIAGASSGTYNDRVLYITTAEFIPALEMRVAQEIKTRLNGYRANSVCRCYPWADTYAGSGPSSTGDGTSDTGANRGRLPLTALPENWGQGSIPALPSWFGNNNWHKAIYYSAAKLATADGGNSCSTCVDYSLSVDGTPGVAALIFTPGTPLGAIVRPSNVVSNYLEDAANNDNANDLYVTPALASGAVLDRDRLTVMDAGLIPNCTAVGSQLASLASSMNGCGMPSWTKLNMQCTELMIRLQPCSSSCVAAAISLATPPCGNNLNPKKCKNDITTLQNSC